MKLTKNGVTSIEVTLSRRNLQTLLNKLDDPASARTLYKVLPNRTLLIVHAESDEKHYEDQEPGQVHPDHDPDLRRAA